MVEENRQLRAQLERVQSNLDESRHVFRQIGNFSSKLGVPVEPKETYRNYLHLFKDLLDLDCANQAATATNNATHIQSLNISEKALRERSNELNSIFENSMVGIMLIKGDRIISRCNQRLADIMGYDSPEEMIGFNTRTLHLSEKRYLDIGKSFSTILSAGRQVQQEIQLRKKDGSVLWCNILGQVLDHSSLPDISKGIVYIIYDISQRKQLEEQLFKNRKLESFAILTGGLGHDFNNIMTAILGNIDLSMAVLDPENPAYSFLQPAKEATLRAIELTAQLQSFSKVSKPILRKTSLPELIDKTTSTSLTNKICLTYHYADDLHDVEIDSNQISNFTVSFYHGDGNTF